MWLYIKYCDGDLSFTNIESSQIPNFTKPFEKNIKYKVLSDKCVREAIIILNADTEEELEVLKATNSRIKYPPIYTLESSSEIDVYGADKAEKDKEKLQQIQNTSQLLKDKLEEKIKVLQTKEEINTEELNSTTTKSLLTNNEFVLNQENSDDGHYAEAESSDNDENSSFPKNIENIKQEKLESLRQPPKNNKSDVDRQEGKKIKDKKKVKTIKCTKEGVEKENIIPQKKKNNDLKKRKYSNVNGIPEKKKLDPEKRPKILCDEKLLPLNAFNLPQKPSELQESNETVNLESNNITTVSCEKAETFEDNTAAQISDITSVNGSPINIEQKITTSVHYIAENNTSKIKENENEDSIKKQTKNENQKKLKIKKRKKQKRNHKEKNETHNVSTEIMKLRNELQKKDELIERLKNNLQENEKVMENLKKDKEAIQRRNEGLQDKILSKIDEFAARSVNPFSVESLGDIPIGFKDLEHQRIYCGHGVYLNLEAYYTAVNASYKKKPKR